MGGEDEDEEDSEPLEEDEAVDEVHARAGLGAQVADDEENVVGGPTDGCVELFKGALANTVIRGGRYTDSAWEDLGVGRELEGGLDIIVVSLSWPISNNE